MKQLVITVFILLCMFCASAQEAASEQATGLRAGGKIYVVLVVVLTILIGLILYVIRLDRKISRMEKVS